MKNKNLERKRKVVGIVLALGTLALVAGILVTLYQTMQVDWVTPYKSRPSLASHGLQARFQSRQCRRMGQRSSDPLKLADSRPEGRPGALLPAELPHDALAAGEHGGGEVAARVLL